MSPYRINAAPLRLGPRMYSGKLVLLVFEVTLAIVWLLAEHLDSFIRYAW